MTVEHMDNFSLYGVGGQAYLLDGVYAQIGSFSSTLLVEDPDPNVSGPVVRIQQGSGWTSVLRLVLSAPQATVGIATRFWMSYLPADSGDAPHIFSWRDGSNNEQAYVTVDTTGQLIAYIGGVAVGNSGGPVLTANGWWHIEAKLVLAGALSTIEVRVEGITKVTGTGTTAADCAQVAMVNGGGGSGQNFFCYWKDFIVWNGLGALNNDFMGSCSVYSIIPDSDVAATWARNVGADNFGNINEDGPPDDDTAYIYAVTPAPAANVMGLSNLPVDVTSVRALMAIQRSKKTDGGDGNVQAGLISGASTALGADRPITTAYTYFRDVIETDPATAAQWTPGAVNAAQLQLNRTL